MVEALPTLLDIAVREAVERILAEVREGKKLTDSEVTLLLVGELARRVDELRDSLNRRIDELKDGLNRRVDDSRDMVVTVVKALEKRIEGLEDRIEGLEGRVGALEGRVGGLRVRLGGLELRFLRSSLM
ncbi:MAG: hypothetical protein DRN96_09830 [Thermoproteota archaeon]|nr:MAG: hypothetical protein DRN96_09830 [Candidatus Korarchaeota archaeon]